MRLFPKRDESIFIDFKILADKYIWAWIASFGMLINSVSTTSFVGEL